MEILKQMFETVRHNGANITIVFDEGDPPQPQTLTLQPAGSAWTGDLAAAGKGSGVHGFQVATPTSLKNGQVHTIGIRYGGTSTDLFVTPRAISCAP